MSTYLNHFTQPDTIIPNLANPQALNRYSYVFNNPINFNDPSGHCIPGYNCPGDKKDETSGTVPPPPNSCIICPTGGGGGGEPEGGIVNSPVSGKNDSGNDLIAGFLPKPEWWGPGWWNNPDAINDLATTTQDIATFFSSAGAFFELASTAVGCLGGLAGFGAGFLSGLELHYNVTNKPETFFSFVSAGFTLRHDIWLEKNTRWDSNSGVLIIGEPAATTAITAIAGGVSPSGIIDAAIDIYSTRYNHGEVQGIYDKFGIRGKEMKGNIMKIHTLFSSLFMVLVTFMVTACKTIDSEMTFRDNNFPLHQRWKFRADNKINSLAVSNKRIALGTLDGINVVDLDSGQLIWTSDFLIDPKSPLLMTEDYLLASNNTQMKVLSNNGDNLTTIEFDRNKKNARVISSHENFVFVLRTPSWILEVYNLDNGSSDMTV